MRQGHQHTFRIGYGFDWATCLVQLEQSVPQLDSPHHYDIQRSYYDTHDWALFHHGLLLDGVAEGGSTQLTLRRESDLRTLASAAVKEAPGLIDSLPRHGFHKRLRGLLKLRCLLPMSTINVEGELIRVRDGEGKVLGELRYERWVTEEGSGLDPRQWIVIIPLKGYEQEFDRVMAVVHRNPALESLSHPLMNEICAYSHRHPGDYCNKPPVALSRGMPIAEAVRAILRLHFQVMQDNEQGIVEDLDTEFLHDYRIAVRKSRSILNLIKGIFPQRLLDPLIEDLGRLQSLTGPTRDMDAYFLNIEHYMADMEDQVAHDLEPVLEQIQLRRGKAQKILSEGLQSAVGAFPQWALARGEGCSCWRASGT